MSIESFYINSHVEDLEAGIKAMSTATEPNRIFEVTYAISDITRDFRLNGWGRYLRDEEKPAIEDVYKRVDQVIEEALKTYKTILKETPAPKNIDKKFPTLYSIVEEYKNQIAMRGGFIMNPASSPEGMALRL